MHLSDSSNAVVLVIIQRYRCCHTSLGSTYQRKRILLELILCEAIRLCIASSVHREFKQRLSQRPWPTFLTQAPCLGWLQGYTQFGGQRPFGVSLLYAGWDEQYGFQLYRSDPSGNYGGWKAVAIGAGGGPRIVDLWRRFDGRVTSPSEAFLRQA